MDKEMFPLGIRMVNINYALFFLALMSSSVQPVTDNAIYVGEFADFFNLLLLKVNSLYLADGSPHGLCLVSIVTKAGTSGCVVEVLGCLL